GPGAAGCEARLGGECRPGGRAAGPREAPHGVGPPDYAAIRKAREEPGDIGAELEQAPQNGGLLVGRGDREPAEESCGCGGQPLPAPGGAAQKSAALAVGVGANFRREQSGPGLPAAVDALGL